jgi:hypothetical protein
MFGQAPVHIPYTALIQQFNAAPPGKLYLLHGSASVFRLSLSAAAHVLLTGVPMTLVDGTNRFDLYYLAEFARRFAQRSALERPERLAGRCMLPEDILNSIFVSRAFTCYQMEALITDRLPVFVEKTASPSVIIFGLLDTFYDEQAPMFEVRKSLQRILTALHRLKSEGISVLLASLDVRLASNERSSLLPRLASTMDRVYAVVEDEGRPRILRESPRGGVVNDRNRLNDRKRAAVRVPTERNVPDGRNRYG